MKDLDLGVGVLDVIAHCDEGSQVAAIDKKFQAAVREAIALGGAKLSLVITLKCEVQGLDTMLSSVSFVCNTPVRKQMTKSKFHLDTEIDHGHDGRGRTVVDATVHIINPRQTRIVYPMPSIVEDKN